MAPRVSPAPPSRPGRPGWGRTQGRGCQVMALAWASARSLAERGSSGGSPGPCADALGLVVGGQEGGGLLRLLSCSLRGRPPGPAPEGQGLVGLAEPCQGLALDRALGRRSGAGEAGGIGRGEAGRLDRRRRRLVHRRPRMARGWARRQKKIPRPLCRGHDQQDDAKPLHEAVPWVDHQTFISCTKSAAPFSARDLSPASLKASASSLPRASKRSSRAGRPGWAPEARTR